MHTQKHTQPHYSHLFPYIYQTGSEGQMERNNICYGEELPRLWLPCLCRRAFHPCSIQCFLVLETRHHRLVLCVESGTHTADQFIALSDLGIFQHSYSSNKQDKGNDAYFPTFRQEQKEPQPCNGTAMADRFPILTDHKILPYPLLNRRV